MKSTTFTIIASKSDTAGMNMAEELTKHNLSVYYVEQESVYEEKICGKVSGDILIFISKHRSEQGTKTLTVHPVGNFHEAKFGGQPEKLSPAHSFFLKHIFKILNKKATSAGLGEKHKISLEVTHHGPYLEKPAIYIEIGSSETEWKDKQAGKVMADVVKEAIETFNEDADVDAGADADWIPCIGFGGRHYPHAFNKIQLNTNYAVGHIMPEYALPLTQDILDQMLSKTLPRPKLALIDWKGVGKSEQRKQIIKLLEKNNIEYIRTSKIEK